MAVVLFVCTGNLCRSPSAASLLRLQLDEAGVTDVTVASAGILEVDVGTPPPLVEEGRSFGIDLSVHVPRTIEPALIEGADLVVGLAREHVRETVVSVPPSFPRTFTLREIGRRGHETGPRGPSEALGAWLDHLQHGRLRTDLLGASPVDDVLDPMGGRPDDYRRMLTEVAALTETLRRLAWPVEEFEESNEPRSEPQ